MWARAKETERTSTIVSGEAANGEGDAAHLGQMATRGQMGLLEQMAPRCREGHRPAPDTLTSDNLCKMATVSKNGTGTHQGKTERPKGREPSEELSLMRKLRWDGEPTYKSIFTEASSWEKQVWEVALSSHQNNNKS